jgi:hypothetical protein
MTEHQDALLDAAYDYTRRGLRVIALTGKAPNVHVHRRGLYDALTAVDTTSHFEAAFLHPDTTGIGILTGDPYYVIDIDGEEGAKAWKDLIGEDAFIPDRWTASTGRGLHLWFAHSKHFCTSRHDCEMEWRSTKLAEKLDFKGASGYVAAPPSVHPSGRKYTWLWEPDDGPPLEMPERVHRILWRSQVVEASAMESTRHSLKNRKRKHCLEDGMLYGTVAFGPILDKMRNESEGNRNGMLFWCAKTMQEEGAEQSDYDDLFNAASAAGLSPYEIRTTIRSALRG